MDAVAAGSRGLPALHARPGRRQLAIAGRSNGPSAKTCWPPRGRHPTRQLRASLETDAARTIHDLLTAGSLADAERAIGALPAVSRSFIDAISPIRHVDGLRADVYLMHDTADHHVPVRRVAGAGIGPRGCRRPAGVFRVPPLRPRAARRHRLPRRRPGARQAPAPRADAAGGDPLTAPAEEGERAQDQQHGDRGDHEPGDPWVRAPRQRLVRAPAASLGSAHAALHVRRKRNGVVSASRLETDRSCLRVRFSSLPW